MDVNALLLLSSKQPPHPVEELAWHAQYCERTGQPSAMATTRVLSGLVPGRSIIAFYGDAVLNNHLLGYAGFVGFDRLGTTRGDQLLRESELYTPGNHPPGLKGVLRMEALRIAPPGAEVDALQGRMRANGVPLTRATLPVGPARILIYFTRDAA